MEGRRRITLYDQMTAGSSGARDSLASLMLDDAVFKKAEAGGSLKLSRSRTLQDIIREEKPNGEHAKDRSSWRAFKEKLRLRRSFGSAWRSTTVNHNDEEGGDNNILPEAHHGSAASTTRQNDVVLLDAADSDPTSRFEGAAESAEAGDFSEEENSHDAVVGVSLMHLLEEAEQEMDLYRAGNDDDEDDVAEENENKRKKEEDGEEEEVKEGGAVEYNCCVCMVRHKGAAFIPCGHTFCRMCSRQIWVSNGNCPLCNNLILEILDIY